MNEAPQLEIEALTVRLGGTVAVDELSLKLKGGRIHGLLGRNGAGKSSLLSVLTAQRKATSGTVTLDGRPVFENAQATEQICLIDGAGPIEGFTRVRDALAFSAVMRPRWDREYAERLSERLGLEPSARLNRLSQGGHAALGVVLGLASRAPVTIFDETYNGLDAPARQLFYQELLDNQRETPRTLVLSSHLVEETAPVFEEIVILDHGRLLLQEETDELREQGAWATGPADKVERFCETLDVLKTRRLGGTATALVHGPLTSDRREEADKWGLKLAPASLNDLFIHLTDPSRSAS